MKFIEMPKELQTKSIETLSLNYGMPEKIIEKDWWVSTVMRALFALPYANQMSFKGLCIATHKPLHSISTKGNLMRNGSSWRIMPCFTIRHMLETILSSYTPLT